MISELNQRIVDELEAHGYKKSRELASILGISERTVYRHMNQLLKSGYLKIIAVCNPILLGIAGGWVGLNVEPRSLISIANKLAEHPNISFLAYTLGRFDLLIGAHFTSMEQLSDFLTLELYNVRGVQSVEPMITIAYGKYFSFLWPRAKTATSIQEISYKQDKRSGDDRYIIDKIDENILNLLGEDGLMRPLSIKSKLGISEDKVRKRIRNMIKNDVLRLEVVVNPEMSRDVIRATTGISVSKSAAHTVMSRLIENPAVSTAYMSLGRYNIIISTHFLNTRSLNQFLLKILSSIEGVSKIETFLHLRVVKRLNIIWSYPGNL